MLQTFLRAFAVVLSAALVLTGLATVTSALLVWSSQTWVYLLCGVGLAFCSALFWMALVDTSLARTARLLERQDRRLHDRLSTALEIQASGMATSPLRRALVEDATRMAGTIAPRHGISLGLSPWVQRYLLGGSVLLLACVFLSGQLTGPTTTTQTPESGQQDLVETAGSDLLADLRQVADAFGDTAELEGDQYLQAISQQLSDLAEQLAISDVATETLSAELERLLQHTRTAVELRDYGTRPQGPELQDMLESLAQATKNGVSEDLVETGGEPDGDRPGADGEQQVGPSYLEHAMDSQAVADLNSQALAEAASTAVDANDATVQGTEGAASLQGADLEGLFGSEEAARMNAEQLASLDVPEETNPAGRRVRMELTPEPALTEVRMTPLGVMAWDQQPEILAERDTLAVQLRPVTAQFHTPEQTE